MKKIVKYFFQSLAYTYSNYYKTGYAKSIFHNKPIDRAGNPLPLITYPCIDYISDLDLSSANYLEIGGGNSTFYFSSLVSNVTTVEDRYKDSKNFWFEYLENQIKTLKKENIKLVPLDIKKVDYKNIEKWRRETHNETINKIKRIFKESIHQFDLVLIDGWPLERKTIAKLIADKLSSGALIIVDDTQNCQLCGLTLRKLGYSQINFKGYIPGKTRSCTSIFFKDYIKFKPKNSLFPGGPFYSPSDPVGIWHNS